MFDIRDDSKHLVEGSRDKQGVRFRQNGVWDDTILCDQHEKVCGAGDHYTVTLCRRLGSEAELTECGGAYRILNPRPDLLIRFIYATVWRQVVSAEGRRLGLSLGPFKETIEQHLFGNGKARLSALVGRPSLVMPDGQPARIAIAPYQRRLLDWRVWHFTVGGLDVFLKADSRPFPITWVPFLANDNDPLILPAIDALRIDRIPMLKPILRNMAIKRKQ